VFALVGLCLYVFRKPFEQISESYRDSPEDGNRMVRWDFLFYAFLGLVITLAVRIAGVVLVFTFLIIPATLSALFASSWRERLLVTWITGGLAALLGLLFAERFDFSVGPSIALFLGAALVLVGVLRLCRVEKTSAAAVSVSAALVAFLWFLLRFGSPASG
jgi:zinc/manganese transport system permease protein